MNDAYTDGWCGRCGRKRVDCEKVRIETGKRCVETPVENRKDKDNA